MAYLKDISAILGLSVSTVSKALNGYTEISEETREKVLRAAEEIDYRYRDRKPANHSAPAADAIGVLAPGISKLMESVYYREMLCAMVEEAAECGRDLMIMGAEPSDSGMSWIGRAASQKIAGICLLAGTEWLYSGKIVNLFESGIPMVSIEHEVSGYTSVYNSRRENIRLLLTHMKKRGHSKIAHMGVLSLESERIASVLVQEAEKLDMVCIEVNSGMLGFDKVSALMEQNISCVIFESVEDARGNIRWWREIGRRIPEDLSVVSLGKKDEEPCGEITSIENSPRELGKAAVRVLVRITWHPETDCGEKILVPGVINEGSTLADLSGNSTRKL